MELEKKYFTVYQQGKEMEDQFCLDEDFNVPDAKQDVRRVILSEGNLQFDEIKSVENYIRVSGKLAFKMLYVSDEGMQGIASLEGKIPFEEMIYTEETPLENVFVKESEAVLSVSVIHSRKLNIKAVIDLTVGTDGRKEMEVLTDVAEMEKCFRQYEEVPVLKLFSIKKDTYRIKDEVTLNGTKETIGTVLWSDVAGRKLETRIAGDEILLQGELLFFALYESVDGKMDWVEQTIPYQGKLNCYGAKDAMFHRIYSQIKDVTVEMRMDEDGEFRVFGVEATLEARIVIYEEEKIQILKDMYALNQQCELRRSEKQVEKLLLQNHSKCRFSERLSIPEIQGDILQICHSNARVQIHGTEVVDRGLQVDGILHICFLYVKPDDGAPFDVWQGMVPFSTCLECTGLTPEITHELVGNIEQLSIGFLGENEIEVKAVVAIRSFLKERTLLENVEEVTFAPFSEKEMEKVPGIIGYIVKDGDQLWDLAKKYHTTEKNIKEMNELEKAELKTGQKILIFRENLSIL